MTNETLKPGDEHYRAYVGDPANYDLICATTFNLLTTLGLREHHRLLDVGCGSLRNGRVLLPYLKSGGYVGIEPNRWLVEEGIANEVGADQIAIKQPRFSYRADAAELGEDERFDFILAQSIFSHCGEALVTDWLEQLRPHLADNGLLVATYVRAKVCSGESGWLYPGLVTYTAERFAELVSDSGYAFMPLQWPHTIQQWFIAGHNSESLAWADETGLRFDRAFKKLYRKTGRAPQR